LPFTFTWCASTSLVPAPGGNRPPKKFFPGQVFKGTLAVFPPFVIFVRDGCGPRERLANPTDTTYPVSGLALSVSDPEVLRGEPLEVVGSMVLPTMAILALLLVPFLDRGLAKGAGIVTT
jgi:hypothetical protein